VKSFLCEEGSYLSIILLKGLHMKALTPSQVSVVSGSGIPMPMPKLNGPTVDHKTAEYFHEHGSQIVSGLAGGVIGMAAAALGGPIGALLGGVIGSLASGAIAQAVAPAAKTTT
jgi:hypothetical protein